MTTARLLALLSEAALVDEIDRIGASANIGVVHGAASATPTRKIWSSAGTIILDEDAARRCAAAGLSRRPGIFLVALVPPGADSPAAGVFEAALAVGAQQVCLLPGQAGELVRTVSASGDSCRSERGNGSVAAVIGGRGGAGASLFATALALSGPSELLMDLDPWGGGIDLLIGSESAPGLHWPDIAVRDGRLDWSALREALPRHREISVLSGTRRGHRLTASAVDAVIDAGRRGGATVVCDLPRQLSEVTGSVIEIADLVVMLSSCDVRSCAAASATAAVLTAINPNVGLVVRGPAPGGLRARDIAEIVGLPVLAAMRPEPMLAENLERGGLRLGGRSPLAAAAAAVLTVLRAQPRTQGDWAA